MKKQIALMTLALMSLPALGADLVCENDSGQKLSLHPVQFQRLDADVSYFNGCHEVTYGALKLPTEEGGLYSKTEYKLFRFRQPELSLVVTSREFIGRGGIGHKIINAKLIQPGVEVNFTCHEEN